MLELIHVSSYLRGNTTEQKGNRITIFAEAYRDKNIRSTANVKISLEMDLYLDCLSTSEDEDLLLYFNTEDDWKALKKVFKNPNFAFVVDKDFELMVEDEKEMITLKEF